MLPHWIHLTHDFLWQLEATISFDGLQTLALLSEGRATWSPNSCAQGMAAPICFQCPWKWLYVNTTWSLNDIIQMRHSTFSLLISKYCTLHDLFAEPVNKPSVMDIPGLARTLWKVHCKIPENRIVECLQECISPGHKSERHQSCHHSKANHIALKQQLPIVVASKMLKRPEAQP
jgi:hypothetical protein